eukprot:XP_003724773.2 PREDICTED: E3 ubiquitin-protein ligase TRIM71-like [Strongylocentrotus purpuratus]
MAAKTEEEKAPSSSKNLTCPLCLGIFDEATILTSCGHTFCRKCLKNYDLSHQDLDHMICPLCRKITKLSAKRVDDFLTNVTVNALVDDYHAKSGGDAVFEMRPKCTACKCQQDAVSFCCTCHNSICDKCLDCHLNLKVFEGHEIVSNNGKVSIGHLSEKCCIHKQENNDMFCEDCKVHVCLECVKVGHQNHNIKNQADFEQQLRLKVNDLVQRCVAKKTELEKNIQNIEVQRHEVYTALQKLLDDVSQAYSIKAKELEENHRNLIEQINAVKRSFDDDLNVFKSKDRQRIKSICSSITLVSNDRLGLLETGSLSAHALLCEELDAMLKEATDHTSAAAITKKAQENRFKPADDTRLELGSISESATDHTSAATITKIAQEKKCKPTDHTRLELGSFSESATDHSTSAAAITKKSHPKLQVIQCVDLPTMIKGMTLFSEDSVAIGHVDKPGIYIVDSAGKQEQYTNIPSMTCYDLVFQQDRSLCISMKGSMGSNEVRIYCPNGSRKSNIHFNNSGETVRETVQLNRSPSNEILMVNGNKKVYIYNPTGSTLKHTVPTKHNQVSQVSATRWGLIVTSSAHNKPGVVTVYDRDGNAGESLQDPDDDVNLFAAVDKQDRVYVASVNRWRNKVAISLYDLDDLHLKERVEFNALNLKHGSHYSCFVSLSPDMLAFASSRKLYFIKVSL